jgi:hypothetical protein
MLTWRARLTLLSTRLDLDQRRGSSTVDGTMIGSPLDGCSADVNDTDAGGAPLSEGVPTRKPATARRPLAATVASATDRDGRLNP